VVISILQQAFEQYANRLGREARDEWTKIQCRDADEPLIPGVDDVIDLLGRAMTTGRRHPQTTRQTELIAQSRTIATTSWPSDADLETTAQPHMAGGSCDEDQCAAPHSCLTHTYLGGYM